jgi:hypothetical protein
VAKPGIAVKPSRQQVIGSLLATMILIFLVVRGWHSFFR